MIKSTYFLIVLAAIYLLIYIGSANAQTMSNSSYILLMGNLNSGSGKPTGSGFKVNFTTGQTGANLFSGTNYKVRAGFQYINSIIPFRFTVSTILVDFGTITPGTPITRAQRLTMSNGSAHGYQVTVSQNHNLRVNASGREIPATVCDSGPCTTATAALWSSPTTYGFGYRCDNITGTDCDSQFLTTNFYRPFASSPSAVMVMSSLNVSRSRISDITYKLNVPANQAAGQYTNILNYIATPTF